MLDSLPHSVVIVEGVGVIDVGIDIIGDEVVAIIVGDVLWGMKGRVVDVLDGQAIDALGRGDIWIDRIDWLISGVDGVGVDLDTGVGRWGVVGE